MKFKTLAIHAGHEPKEHLGAVTTPIYQTSTFAFRGVGEPADEGVSWFWADNLKPDP
jgi:O-acetylhomoserine/O-acetylserine sulfhydrylase-like pyridoxal-dependent enzyme